MPVRVFVSYAREDRAFVVPLASVLSRRGFDVWWDRAIGPGVSFHNAIEQALRDADWVLALWSASSVDSRWVVDEAGRGADRGVLIPALIDDTPPPLGFGRIQSVDLRRWNGDAQHPGFRALEARLGSPSTPAKPGDNRAAATSPGVMVAGSRNDPSAEALAPPSARRPASWHCVYCGKRAPPYNDYWCVHCDSPRPYFPETATMRQCGRCSQCNLLHAAYCEWCGAPLSEP